MRRSRGTVQTVGAALLAWADEPAGPVADDDVVPQPLQVGSMPGKMVLLRHA